MFITLLYGLQYRGSDCSQAPFLVWLDVEYGYYVLNFIFSYAYYHDLKTRNRDNIKFMVVNCFLNLVHSGWLIYGNVIFWPNRLQCSDEFGQDDGQNVIMIFIVFLVLGYYTLLKCCGFGTLLICFGPALYRSIRRGSRPDANWVPTSRDLLGQMKKQAFNPEEHPDGIECIICMEEYKEVDEVIELPCDGRHFFHAKCITNWLNTNNSCPLCKKPITKEDL